MTWIWWTISIAAIGAAALVVIVGALLLAVIIAEATASSIAKDMQDEHTDN